MQLKDKLGLAVSSLLTTTVLPVQAADWLVDMSALSYSEQDSQKQDRVKVFEPVLSITKQNAPDDYFNVQLVFDTLSGASPNGAYASSKTQTFTGPSGKSGYQVKPGFTPLDPTFKDARVAANISWMTPITRFSRYLAGVHLSSESDYSSVGGNYSFLQDFNNKLTTLTAGVAYSYDAVNPNGGFHNALSSMGAVTTPTARLATRAITLSGASGSTSSSSEDGEGSGGVNFSFFNGRGKQTWDGILGISHVLNRYTVVNLNYGLTQVSGYQTDPYKLVPIFDAMGYPVDYVYEKRPTLRLKQTLKADVAMALGTDSLHLSYRYYWDDWGIKTHTTDVKYHLALNDQWYFVPHYRLSHQTQANFYHLGLLNTSPHPSYASSDLRLADMTTQTLGGLVGWKFDRKMTMTLNVEQMAQSGNAHPTSAIGDQKNHDMFPTVTAWMMTLGLRTKW